MAILVVLEMDFKYAANDLSCQTNVTQLSQMPECGSTARTLSMCTMVEVMIVVFLSSLVIGRWLMTPSKRMSHEASYLQVASFTTLSADIIEIAQYMQNEQVAESPRILRACQIIFVISLSQFCFSPSAVKHRNGSLRGFRRVVDVVFATEAWSLLLALCTQELPCFILRFVLIFSVTDEQHRDISLYFFVLKNGLMSLLLIYRAVTISCKLFRADRKTMPLAAAAAAATNNDEESPPPKSS